jgi:RNA-directed DNA polymerase
MIFRDETKSVPITKEMVWEAYKKVKSNGGSAGIDQIDLSDFDKVRSKELYKIWNRMASGSYMAPAIKRVTIPKGNGKTRPLGIPTVGDRIAQQVVKAYLEPRLESVFVASSYGYRPNKSAHDAVKEVQQNVLKYCWVIDLDIKEFFENVRHDLLLKALSKHVPEKWVLMYVQRWLESPIILEDGSIKPPTGNGTPQGGVISPLLANLYLHYCVDKWLELRYPNVKMVRYADDLIVHCGSFRIATEVLSSLTSRLTECGLTSHPEKTKIVYCKKDKRDVKGHPVQFDFLGFSFQPMSKKLKSGGSFLQYDCKISRKSKLHILQVLRELRLNSRHHSSIQELANLLNPKIRGWIRYFAAISPRSLKPVFYYLHHRILTWLVKKFKSFKGSKVRAIAWLRVIESSYPNLFYHWEMGYKLF